MSLPPGWIVPDWPAPAGVRAFVTTREGGVSGGEYASMNLGDRGGDDAAAVARNRLLVREHLPAMPRWLVQVHGTAVADLDSLREDEVATADAAAVSVPGRVAVVLVADCMPVFLARADGRRIAVAHAGWRGLSAGIVENALRALGGDPSEAIAWLGPAIGPCAFEVGLEVKQAFLEADAGAEGAFRPHGEGKVLADLYALARRRLARAGVASIHGGGSCTFSEPERFFSHRRSRESGRMGAFAWIDGAA